MQRFHQDDLVGHVLEQDGWEVLSFPAIAEEDETLAFETIFGQQQFQRKLGEALHPERESCRHSRKRGKALGNTTSPANTSDAPSRSGERSGRVNGCDITSRAASRPSSATYCRAATPPTRS